MSDEVDDQPELTAISSFVFQDYDHKWEVVAHYVREGCDDPQFRFLLHRMLDPRDYFRSIRFKEKRRRGRPPKPKNFEHVHVLIRLLYDTERATQALELIAGEIKKNGLEGELLRENLADMFSRVAKGPLGMKFQIDRTGQSGIHSARKVDLERFLEIHAILFDAGTSDTLAAASVIFGAVEDTAESYLKKRRRAYRCDEFRSLEFERQVAYAMREHGYREYQLLAEIMKKHRLKSPAGIL